MKTKTAILMMTFVAVFFCQKVTSQESKRLAVIPVAFVGLDPNESWVAQMVYQRFLSDAKANLIMYTVIDSANEKKIKALQAQSEGDEYDDNSVIEAGHLLSANYGIITSVVKAGTKYALQVNFTNMMNAEVLAAVSTDGEKDAENLAMGAGCAVDMAFLEICDKMNIVLTPNEKYILEFGDKTLSVDKRLEKARADEIAFQKDKDALDELIKKHRNSTDPESAVILPEVEAKQKLAQVKLKQAQEESKRLEAEKKLHDEEAQKDAERSIAEKTRRDDIADALNKKLKKEREANTQALDIFSQIEIVQRKKRALIEIDNEIERRAEELTEKSHSDIAKYEDEALKKSYRRSECNRDGEPSLKAFEKRKKEIDKRKSEMALKCKVEVSNLRASVQKQRSDLRADIERSVKALSSPHKATSLTGDVKASITTWDADKENWEAAVYIYSADAVLFRVPLDIRWADLAKANEALHTSKRDYESFQNDVEVYDSLFARSENVITWEATYKVELREYETFCECTFTLTDLKGWDTLTGKTIVSYSESLEEKRQIDNALDLRNAAEKDEDNRRLAAIERDRMREQAQKEKLDAKEQQKYLEAEKKARMDADKLADEERLKAEQWEKEKARNDQRIARRQARADKAEYIKTADAWAYHTRGGGAKTGLALSAGFTDGVKKGFTFSGEMFIPLSSHIYIGILAAGLPTPGFGYTGFNESVGWADYTFCCVGSLGVNERVHFGRFHPNLFLQVGAGVDVTGGDWENKSSSSSSSSGSSYSSSSSSSSSDISGWTTYRSRFAFRGSAGVDLPVSSVFAFNFTYSLNYEQDVGFGDAYSFGIVFTLPNVRGFGV